MSSASASLCSSRNQGKTRNAARRTGSFVSSPSPCFVNISKSQTNTLEEVLRSGGLALCSEVYAWIIDESERHAQWDIAVSTPIGAAVGLLCDVKWMPESMRRAVARLERLLVWSQYFFLVASMAPGMARRAQR